MRTGPIVERKKLLIIDDDADVLEILKTYLEQSGFEVMTTQSASGIFNMIDQYQPHLVILDYLLNGINGGEICHQVKTSFYGKSIPVVLFSAYPRVLLSLGTYGCDLFIPKPFDLDKFLSSIRQLLPEGAISLMSSKRLTDRDRV